MPDTSTSSNGSGGTNKGAKQHQEKQDSRRRRGRGNNNKKENAQRSNGGTPKNQRSKSPQSSTASSSTVTEDRSKAATSSTTTKNTSSSSFPKVNLLKRGSDTSLLPPRSTPDQSFQVNCIMPSLMDVEVKPTTTMKSQNYKEVFTPEKKSTINLRQSEANIKQRQEYYFSNNPGTAVSADKFQEAFQYGMNTFPLEKNVNIQLDRKYILLITPTTSRCNGLFIKVKSQHGDDQLSTGALLRSDANDEAVRAACKETIDRYVEAKCHNERFPFSKLSEPYLTACYIRRLEQRQDAFPEAIYYCEKCDYHINTVGHAKAHLESSTHFDDIKRQEQRETLLKKIPKPSQAQLAAINKVLNEALEDYQKIRRKGQEHADNIITYLNTSVFPGLGCENVKLQPFGSVTYDVVLPDSDFNIAYTMDLPEGTPIFSLLEKVRRKIADDGHPADHSMEMGTPSTILFTYQDIRVRLCWMSCFNNRSQLCLSDLMKTYVGLRKEVVEFLQIIRLWASCAEVDSKNRPRIGLPRYGFDIMAIHFLQEKKYLPILHEMFDEDSAESSDLNSDDLSLNRDDCSERSKIPPEEAGQRRIRLGLKYEKDLEKIKKKFDLEKKWNNAKLFIEFLRYYVQQHRDGVIQMTQSPPMSRDINRWNKKVLHVVDPFRGDNVLSIPKVSTWQPYYFNCLLTTFLSFAIPRTKNGPVVEIGLIHNKSNNSKKKMRDTPKRDPTITTTSSTPKPISKITEEEFQKAADELAAEEEEARFMENLKQRLVIDGIKYTARKPEDCNIDDHSQGIYSNRSLRRFRRVLDCQLNERIAIPLEEHDLLTKKGKGWMKKWKKRRDSVEEVTEKLDETLKISDSHPIIHARVMCVMASQVLPTDSTSSDTTIKAEPSPASSVKDCGSEATESLSEVVPKTTPDVPITPEQGETQGAPVESDSENPEDQNPKDPGNPETEELEIEADHRTDSEAPPTPAPKTPKTTFAKPLLPQGSVEKQTCSEEFFIKENLAANEIQQKSRKISPSEYHYEFNNDAFCGGYEMEMKCTHCDGSHCVENCPMMEIPPIKKYEARTAEELKDIDNIIDKYYEENILTQHRLDLMESRKKELEEYLKKNYQKDIHLTIFGSVMTGLSVNCSDIDICLRFGDGDVPPKDRTPKEVILKVEEVLRKCGMVKRVQAIVTAKVPIVKFQLRLKTGEMVDADISYYNILAIYNTALLREYTLWTPDSRFAKLALFIKKWAKSCDIGDASRGSLSSYAHIILLISYLQNCDPPVLPRLQEDFRSDNDEKRLVDNWNTSYAQVEDELVQNWPKNKETCAQLLIGYFDYYSRYDFRNFVVQCRREMILSKMEKDWPRPICVEDPFDLNHNLSSGVTKKMFVFIMKVFISSRAAFMSEKPAAARDINFTTSYQHQLLRKCNQGSAPSDRQCHNCHRIGHFVESCPQRAQLKDSRRRYGSSNSTTSSYRSDAGGNNKKGPQDEGSLDVLKFHKRTYYNRSYK
ncbi:CBN-CID-1 protein [Caenorhabditis brenneri]|uniref:CBN-CID-1 protein n=1 Tax=Caenorhabditis brenneri TaxID=135651 RepID=G0N3K2_CAEBE|nr:CBN-CID-1 protein [Caenorhabditis brenneri]